MGGCKNNWENKNESRQRMTQMHQRNWAERKSSGWGNAVKEKKAISSYREREADVGCLLLGKRKHGQKQRWHHRTAAGHSRSTTTTTVRALHWSMTDTGRTTPSITCSVSADRHTLSWTQLRYYKKEDRRTPANWQRGLKLNSGLIKSWRTDLPIYELNITIVLVL